MTPVVGIDPGQCGAAVRMEGDRVTAWAVWSTMKRKDETVIRMRLHDGGGRVYWNGTEYADRSVYQDTCPHPHNMSKLLVDFLHLEEPVTLCVEDLFIDSRQGKAKRDPQVQLRLAEWTGELVGPLRRYTVGPVLRPMAWQWRHRILGLPKRTKGDFAEDKAREYAPRIFRYDAPEQLTKAERGALAEAACIARWGWLARDPPGRPLTEVLQD